MISLLFKRIIRVSGFIGKEVREIVRQPRLLLSLLLGPFLILLIFGVGYLGPSPKLKGILVLPNDPSFQSQKDALAKQFSTGMDVMDVTTNLGAARAPACATARSTWSSRCRPTPPSRSAAARRRSSRSTTMRSTRWARAGSCWAR